MKHLLNRAATWAKLVQLALVRPGPNHCGGGDLPILVPNYAPVRSGEKKEFTFSQKVTHTRAHTHTHTNTNTHTHTYTPSHSQWLGFVKYILHVKYQLKKEPLL